MKSRKLIELAVATFITTSSTVYCQKIAKIEDLGSRVEKLWEVAIPIQPNKNHPSGIAYALLKTGVAVLSPDQKTISCYDYNSGQLIWQVPNSTNGGIYSTVNGEYLFSQARDEGGSEIAVYSSDGQQLWDSIQESSFFRITPSGKYLITEYSFTTPGVLKVFELSTGKKLWQLDEVSWWQAEAGLNDRIAYYQRGKLKYFKLDNGELIWEKPVEFDPRSDFGQVHVSLQGNVIAYDNFIITAINRDRPTTDHRRTMYVFDDSGELLWQRSKAAIPNRSSGGIVRAISENGEYIAIQDGAGFSIYDISKQSELFTFVEHGFGPITMFTNELIASYPDLSTQTTKILSLRKDGKLSNKYELEQFIDFSYDRRTGGLLSGREISEIKPVVVKNINGRIVLSKVSLSLE